MEQNEQIAYIGMDLGGTKLHSVLADSSLQVLAEEHTLLSDMGGSANQALRQHMESLSRAALRYGRRIAGAGLGVPAVYLPDTDSVVADTNLQSLSLSAVRDAAKTLLGAELRVMNDVRCAAWAEKQAGRARTSDDFIYINLGTGISMAAYSGGRFIRGCRNGAGEIGYWISPEHVDGSPERFDYDNTPLEDVASGRGLQGRAAALGVRLSAKDVCARARAGDGDCLALLCEMSGRLAAALVDICLLLEPELAVFGGGLSHQLDLFLPCLSRTVQARLPCPPQLCRAACGDDAGWLGALCLARETAGP